jgi:DNA-binding transcriptional LysR family regulator
MRIMEIYQVRYFMAVCSELNFTRAAEKCNVSQPSLTRAIQLLEKEFGGYLFHRQRSPIELTDLGKLIRPYLDEVWQTAFAARRIAKDYMALHSQRLELAVMCTIAPKLLIQLLCRFRTNHPSIKVQLIDGTAQNLEEQLLGFQIEAAIYCRPDRNPDPRLNYLPLFKERMMIALPKDHRLSKRSSIRIQDLDGEFFVSRAFCEFNDMVKTSVSDSGLKFDVIYRSDKDDWVLAMIASGFGFGFVPEHSIDHPGVAALPLHDPDYWRTVNLVTVRNRPQSRAVGALVHEAMKTEWADREAIAVAMHSIKG